MAAAPLRRNPFGEFLVEKVAHYWGIQASPGEVLITSGSNQGIELLNEVLLEPGDTVITELSTYQDAVSRLRKC